MRSRAATALAGVGLGFALSRIGFTSFDETQRMFTFSDLRMFFAFAGATALLFVVWPLLGRLTGARWAARPLHPGILPGGLLFGVGWALTGACPSAVFAQLGEGQWAALATLGGVLMGNAVFASLQPRFFRWSIGACSED